MTHLPVEEAPVALDVQVRQNIEQAQLDVILAGFPKCGTTSFAHWLDTSPKISVSNPKETFLLCRELRRAGAIAPEGELDRCFSDREAPIRIEASTLNAYSEVLRGVMTEFPHLKLILSFRDPVDAVISWHNQVQQAGEAIAPDFQRCWQRSVLEQEQPQPEPLTLMQNYALVCQFGFWLSRWVDTIGHDRLLIVDAGELKGDGIDLRRRLDAFLGNEIGLTDAPPVLNSYASLRFESLYKKLKGSFVNRRLRDIERRFPALSGLRRNAKEKFFRKKSTKKFEDTTKSQLASYFAADVALAQQLYRDNLDRWDTARVRV